MVDYVNEAIFLGIFTDFDLDSGASMVGATVGSAGDPINLSRVVDITHHDVDDNGIIEEASGDTIEWAIGGVSQGESAFDNLATVKATITYTDGTPPFNGLFVINQTQDGSVFVVSWGGASITAGQIAANAALEAAPIQSFSIIVLNTSPQGETVPNVPVDILCFTKGTMILTSTGEKPVEQLEVGDMVATKDHGMQELRWVGSTTVPATGEFAPIMIQKGAMGNARNLRVSPQHRILVQGWKAELLFGEREVLVAAKHLVNKDTIYVSEGDTVEYFHILFDTHQIIFANGIPSESFYPGKQGINILTMEIHEEILSLFPELRESLDTYGPMARTSLKKHEAKVLSENPDFLTYQPDQHPQ